MQRRNFFFGSFINAVISVRNFFVKPLVEHTVQLEGPSRSRTSVACCCETLIESNNKNVLRCSTETYTSRGVIPSVNHIVTQQLSVVLPYARNSELEKPNEENGHGVHTHNTSYIVQPFLRANPFFRSFSALQRFCSGSTDALLMYSNSTLFGLYVSRRYGHTVGSSGSSGSASSKSRRKKLKRSKRASIVPSLPASSLFSTVSPAAKAGREKSSPTSATSSSTSNASLSNTTAGTGSSTKGSSSKGSTASNASHGTSSPSTTSALSSVVAAVAAASSVSSKKSKSKASKKRHAVVQQDEIVHPSPSSLTSSIGNAKGSPASATAAAVTAERVAQLFPSANPAGAPNTNTTLVQKKKKKMKIKMVKKNGKMVRVAVPVSSSSSTAAAAGGTAASASVPSSSSSAVSSSTGSRSSASNAGTSTVAKTRISSSSSPSSTSKTMQNPLLFPDHREQILRIFQQLGDVNNALGEVYKSKSYTFALQELRRGDYIFRVLPPNLRPLTQEQVTKLMADPDQQSHLSDMTSYLERRQRVLDPHFVLHGVGDKLRKKIIEILETGDLQELHAVNKRPEVSAMRELCEVHGFGPRTALSLYRSHKIKTVAELKKISASPDCPVSLNDGQRLGLKYFDDIQKRIPHEEGKMHEAYLKARLKKHFGSAFLLTVCGSFRRRTDFSGDIDVLLTPNPEYLTSMAGAKKASGKKGADNPVVSLPVPPQDAVRAFVDALREDGYIEATFAQGSTKFMGMGRLKGAAPASLASNPIVKGKKNKKISGKKVDAAPTYLARRIDVRYVDAPSFPAALLYFTGSKNFNVVMRARAVKLHLVLNEYGLFRQNFEAAAHGTNHRPLSSINELITGLTKYQFWSRGENALSDPAIKDHASKQKELDFLVKQVNFLRVKTSSEQDIFDVLGMSYVEPWERCM